MENRYRRCHPASGGCQASGCSGRPPGPRPHVQLRLVLSLCPMTVTQFGTIRLWTEELLDRCLHEPDFSTPHLSSRCFSLAAVTTAWAPIPIQVPIPSRPLRRRSR